MKFLCEIVVKSEHLCESNGFASKVELAIQQAFINWTSQIFKRWQKTGPLIGLYGKKGWFSNGKVM